VGEKPGHRGPRKQASLPNSKRGGCRGKKGKPDMGFGRHKKGVFFFWVFEGGGFWGVLGRRSFFVRGVGVFFFGWGGVGVLLWGKVPMQGSKEGGGGCESMGWGLAFLEERREMLNHLGRGEGGGGTGKKIRKRVPFFGNCPKGMGGGGETWGDGGAGGRNVRRGNWGKTFLRGGGRGETDGGGGAWPGFGFLGEEKSFLQKDMPLQKRVKKKGGVLGARGGLFFGVVFGGGGCGGFLRVVGGGLVGGGGGRDVLGGLFSMGACGV